MPPQVDKEIKQRKDLKILNLNKLFTKISVLLAQIKAGNDSNKLKKKSHKCYLFYQNNKITKKV